MTNQEAIEVLKDDIIDNSDRNGTSKVMEAEQKAIEALKIMEKMEAGGMLAIQENVWDSVQGGAAWRKE